MTPSNKNHTFCPAVAYPDPETGEAPAISGRPGRPATASGPAQLLVTSVFSLLPSEPVIGAQPGSPARAGGSGQQRLFDLLKANGRDVLEHSVGFLGSDLTCTEDGQHVVHHAAWSSEHDLRQMLASPGARASMRAVRDLATVTVLRSSTYQHFGHGPASPQTTISSPPV